MVAQARAPRATGYTTGPQFVAVTTFANIKLLTGAEYSGKFAFATDLGYGAILRNDGTKWRHIHRIKVGSISAPVVVSNTTATTEVASITVPGDLIPRPGGVIWVFAHFSFTASTNLKTLSATINGNAVNTVQGYSGSNGGVLLMPITVASSSAQVSASNTTSGIGPCGTVFSLTENLANDAVIRIFGKMASGSETLTLHGAYVELV